MITGAEGAVPKKSEEIKMRQRIRELNRFQKAILILLAVIAVLFSVVYIREKSRSGYVYNNTILIRNEENGNKVYSGKISGKEAQ